MKKREAALTEQKANSATLENTLASLGALSAVMMIRKSYLVSESSSDFNHHQVDDANLRLA